MNPTGLLLIILSGVLCVVTLLSLVDIPTLEIPSVEFKRVIKETNSLNTVTAYYLNYRLYDTMFEIFVFTLAIYGVVFFLRDLPSIEKHVPFNDPVMNFYSRITFIISTIIAFYIALVGHLSPGGGFVAGMVAGTGMMIVSLTKNIDEIEKQFKINSISTYERIVLFSIIMLVTFPSVMGKETFYNFLPLGETGRILSAGLIPLFDLLIFSKVMLGSWNIVYYFIKHRGVV